MNGNLKGMVMKDNKIIWFSAIFVLGYLIRFIFILELKDNYFFFFHPVIDAATAHKAAINIAGGDLLNQRVFIWQAPFYSYFLAGVYKLTSFMKAFTEHKAIYTVKMLQILLGSINCFLISYIGMKFISRPVGILAGFIVALYGPFMVFEADLTGVVFHIFFNLCSIILLLKAVEKKNSLLFLAAGGTIGLSALTIPNIMLFLPAAFLWAFYCLEKSDNVCRQPFLQRKSWRLSSLIIVGSLIVILPWTARNYIIEKTFIFISPNGGLNFYIGNNPDYQKTINIRPGAEWDVLMSMPVEEAGVRYTESSNYYLRKSWEFIKDKPYDYSLLMLRKLYLFWHGEEVKRNQDMYTHREFSGIFSCLVWKNVIAFPFGIIGPLSIIGIILAIRKKETPALLIIFILVYMLSVILFFVTDRYRLPVIPILILYASYALVVLQRYLTQKKMKKAFLMLLSLIILIIFLNHGVARGQRIDPEYYFYKGVVLIQEKDFQGATENLNICTTLDPDNAEAFYRKGIAYTHLGDKEQAGESFHVAIKLNPVYKYIVNRRL
jgi:4-amino-4-deoxy-L-arabinose transferase-like glycosyltransferase